MASLRWTKISRDVQSSKGRLFLMVVAVAASIFGVATILGSYSILTREVSLNYLRTNPASAQIELDRVDEDLLREVRERPGIADAEASSSVLARVRSGDRRRPLLLFVVPDFEGMRINTFAPEAGAWPPPRHTLLLERTALGLLGSGIGDSVEVQTPGGAKEEGPNLRYRARSRAEPLPPGAVRLRLRDPCDPCLAG